MPFLLRNLTISLEDGGDDLVGERLRARLAAGGLRPVSFSIVRKGVDARRKKQIKFVYTVLFRVDDEERHRQFILQDPDFEFLEERPETVFPQLAVKKRIVVAGMGPAGLFTALRLSAYGITSLLIERGKPVEERIRDVNSFWGKGLLDPESNVQFGEGGAGTFSDGKLTTRVRDVNMDYILRELVRFGAPDDILFLAKPHIGTDRLRGVVANMRRHLEEQGVTIRFSTKLTDIISGGGRLSAVVLNDREDYPCDMLVLAPGHSARDTYRMLLERGIRIEPKPFAVGVRVEHPQELINLIQYGMPSHPMLPPADYALAWNDARSGRSAYSFCMCPGGEVVASSSEAGGVVTNGMSHYYRSAPRANSALVVTVGSRDFGDVSPLAGAAFQRSLEQSAFAAGGGGYHAPAQNLLTFLNGKGHGPIGSSYRPGVRESDLSLILPDFVTATMRDGIRQFERKMRGFISAEACLIGVETRTSAPVRIVRGDDLQSVSLAGFYPAGEGAGYAGGIMSAALDGVRIADRIAGQFN